MLKKHASIGEAAPTDLGSALRAQRKVMGFTMQHVADSAGLSVGFISQVERGLTAPSLASLVALAEVLETPLSQFLGQPAQDSQTTRGDARPTYSVAGAEVSYERLSTTFEGSQIHSVIVHEPPGFRGEPISHRGEEMFFILGGEITVEIEGEVEILRTGDSIHFDSMRVHSTWNHGDGIASILWCGTMDIFGAAPGPIHKNASRQEGHTQPTGEQDT